MLHGTCACDLDVPDFSPSGFFGFATFISHRGRGRPSSQSASNPDNPDFALASLVGRGPDFLLADPFGR